MGATASQSGGADETVKKAGTEKIEGSAASDKTETGPTKVEEGTKKPTKEDPSSATVTELPGLIGSVDEYATILGKTTDQVHEEKFQPPEVSESEGEESAAEDEGDLWGAIMGGS